MMNVHSTPIALPCIVVTLQMYADMLYNNTQTTKHFLDASHNFCVIFPYMLYAVLTQVHVYSLHKHVMKRWFLDTTSERLQGVSSPQSLVFICQTWRNCRFQFVTLRQKNATTCIEVMTWAKYVLNMDKHSCPMRH